ncbi:MAG: endonuclease/exonuclease/phosphatase family protein [Myxococcales bacterium]
MRRFSTFWWAVLLSMVLPCFAAQSASAQVTSLKLMSFNVWVGASNVTNGEAKARAAITQAGADIVAIQESNGLAARLASQLGWYSVQPANSVAVLSRYPITQTLGVALNSAGVGVRVQLSSNPPQDVIVWSAHLTSSPYAPYDACLKRLSAAKVIRNQEQTQLPEIRSILSQMAPYVANADNVPVFLLGDFNTPSHLDWTSATADRHCGYTLALPVTQEIQNAGLSDAYREVYPDPRQNPGITWSPIYQTYVYADGKPEPLDRIDMAHYAGAGVTLASTSVFVVGTPQQVPNYANNQWPSDHASLVVDVRLDPGGGENPPPASTLTLNKTSYAAGEAITATFANGAGNAKDWVGIYKSGQTPGQTGSTAWLYTNGKQSVTGTTGPRSGTLTFSTGAKPTWPLPTGSYTAYFLENDGYGVLAGPVVFTVR